MPCPSSAMNTRDSAPSNSIITCTRVAPAAMLLSTMSATAVGKS
jgi:hypothetical protein